MVVSGAMTSNPLPQNTSTMKSTQERLAESYCRPQTEEEWAMFGLIPLIGHYVAWLGGEPTLISGKFRDRTLIPVPHFIDLMHDRIAPWRLEEDGFNQITPYLQTRQYCFDFVTVTFEAENVHVTIPDRLGAFGIRRCNVTTYTQLLTLIEHIG